MAGVPGTRRHATASQPTVLVFSSSPPPPAPTAPDATRIPASPPHRIEHSRGYHRCCYHRVSLRPRQIPLRLRRRGRAGERRPRLRLRRLPRRVAPTRLAPLQGGGAHALHSLRGGPVLFLSTPDPEVSGATDELLRQVYARFEGKPRVAPSERLAVRASLAAVAAAEVAELVRLQHRSAERHLEGVAAKVAELVKKAGKERGVVEGAEVRRVGKWYGDAMEVMLEHARM